MNPVRLTEFKRETNEVQLATRRNFSGVSVSEPGGTRSASTR